MYVAGEQVAFKSEEGHGRLEPKPALPLGKLQGHGRVMANYRGTGRVMEAPWLAAQKK